MTAVTFQEDSGTNETRDQGNMNQTLESNQITDIQVPNIQVHSSKFQKIGEKSKVLLNKIRKFR